MKHFTFYKKFYKNKTLEGVRDQSRFHGTTRLDRQVERSESGTSGTPGSESSSVTVLVKILPVGITSRLQVEELLCTQSSRSGSRRRRTQGHVTVHVEVSTSTWATGFRRVRGSR